MTLDPRQLRSFLAIVDCGSLARAADAANLTASALSRVIRDLELRLGVKLFERHPKGMVLTPYGEALIPHARSLLFGIRQAIETLDDLRGLKRGTARIGTVAAVARTVLPSAFARLAAAAPGIRAELLEAPDDKLAAALAQHEVDLIITGNTYHADDESLTIARCVVDDVCQVFGASGHPFNTIAKISLEQVLSQGWTMPARGTAPRRMFEEAIRATGFKMPDIVLETDSIGAMIAFVTDSQCLGWLPSPLLKTDVEAGRIRIFDIPELAKTRPFLVHRRRRGLLPPAIVRLLEELPLTPVHLE